MGGHVLIVDDERESTQRMVESLESHGHLVTVVHDPAAGVAAVENHRPDVVLTELDVHGESGLDLCSALIDAHPKLPVIVVTDHATLDAAVRALRLGVFDFLTSPIELDQLEHRIERALTHRDLVTEVERLRRVTHAAWKADILGESTPIKRLFSLIERLGDSDVNVLITGESGVGKELVARSLHRQRAAAERPFVAVNCAAVPANLIESELFGHVRGAFTDAKRNRDGLFVRANGGTLFLDEIGELPMEIQPKLLRVLQERRVTRVGDEREIPFDSRIICATNRDLEEDVERGHFREDLFYRVNVVRLHVPPLRARGTDVLLLAQHFVEQAAERSGHGVQGLSTNAAAKLMAYDWPGNVRELQNAMERGVALARGDAIEVEDLPRRIRSHRCSDMVLASSDPSELLTLEQLEARYIRRVLELVKGNKTRAAEILGVGRRTLYRRLERLEAEAVRESERRVSA